MLRTLIFFGCIFLVCLGVIFLLVLTGVFDNFLDQDNHLIKTDENGYTDCFIIGNGTSTIVFCNPELDK